MTELLTHSHAAGPTDVPLIEETIAVNLAHTVAKYPQNIALIDAAAQRQWTYEEFHHDVRKLATGLHRAGISTGERDRKSVV